MFAPRRGWSDGSRQQSARHRGGQADARDNEWDEEVNNNEGKFNEVYVGIFPDFIVRNDLANFVRSLGYPPPEPSEVSMPIGASCYGFVCMRSKQEADRITAGSPYPLPNDYDVFDDYDDFGDYGTMITVNLSDVSRKHRLDYGIALHDETVANEEIVGTNNEEETLSDYASFKKLSIKEKEDLEKEYRKSSKNIQDQLEDLSTKKSTAEKQKKDAEDQMVEAQSKVAAAMALIKAVEVQRDELLQEGQALKKRHAQRLEELEKTASLLQDERNGGHCSLDDSDATKRKIMKELECICCYDNLTGHILQCEEGHLICKDCIKKVAECPVCRAKYQQKRIRNRFAESLVTNMKIDSANGDLAN